MGDENSLRSLRKRLEETTREKDFYLKIFSKMRAAVHINEIISSETSVVRWINDGVSNLSGWKPSDIIDNPDFLKENIIGDAGVIKKSIDKFTEEPDKSHIGVYKIRTKDGSEVWHQSYVTPFEYDKNGKLTKSLSVAVDINNKIINIEELSLLVSEYKQKLNRIRIKNLTKAELEVAKLIASGLTLKKIAEKLNRSYHTIESHKRNIFHKLEIKKISGIIKMIYESGLYDE